MPVSADLTRRVVRRSRKQNGAIKTEQLHAAGLTRHAIDARVKRGRLVPWFYGVYIVGDPELMPLARQSAALLSLGPTAVLSHRSAAAIWGFAQADLEVIDVTIVGCNRRERAGVRLHRVKALPDVTTRSNLRLTTPARTAIDLASQASTSELSEAFGEARAKRLVTDAKLNTALKRAPRNHPGAALVRAVLHEAAPTIARRRSGSCAATSTRRDCPNRWPT
jgi:hypothetical protein